MLDVKRLQVLLSVVELGSVTAAADALVYTPVGGVPAAASAGTRGGPAADAPARPRDVADRRGPGARGARPHGAPPAVRGRGGPGRDRRAAPGQARRWAPSRPSPARSCRWPCAGSASCTRRSGWTSAANVSPSSSSGWRTARSDLSLLWDYAVADGIDSTAARPAPSCSPTPPCCWCPPSTGWPAGGGWRWPSWPRRTGSSGCDHPVVEVLRRAAVAAGFEPKVSFRANDYQEAQAMVGRFRRRAGPAHRGAEPAAERPGHLARHQRCRPPGARRSPQGPRRHARRGRLPQAPRRDRSGLRPGVSRPGRGRLKLTLHAPVLTRDGASRVQRRQAECQST